MGDKVKEILRKQIKDTKARKLEDRYRTTRRIPEKDKKDVVWKKTKLNLQIHDAKGPPSTQTN